MRSLLSFLALLFLCTLPIGVAIIAINQILEDWHRRFYPTLVVASVILLVCLLILAWLLRVSITSFKTQLQRRKEERLRSQGRCRGCGYDIRTLVERCPECGMKVPKYQRASKIQMGTQKNQTTVRDNSL